MAPPSSSGTTVGEALNILSGFPLSTEPRARRSTSTSRPRAWPTPTATAIVGDPRFINVPVAKLLSPTFAAARRCLITGTALTSPLAPGNPFAPIQGCKAARGAVRRRRRAPRPRRTTRTTSSPPTAGATSSPTRTRSTSSEAAARSCPGYGFFLNDELTDFDFAPESNPATHHQHLPDPNLPGPGKQPRSSMGPLIALSHGKPLLAIGAAGGSTIPETILQTFIGHVDFGMSLSRRSPRRGSRRPTRRRRSPSRASTTARCAAPCSSATARSSASRPARSCPSTTIRATRPRSRSSAAGACSRSPSPTGCSAARRSSCHPG